MVIHTKNLDLPGALVINNKFIERIKEIYGSEKRKLRARGHRDELKTTIYFKYFDGSSDEYKNFEEPLSENLPEEIQSLRIDFKNYSISKKHISVSLILDLKSEFLSGCVVKGSKKESVIRIIGEIAKVFDDFKTNSSWIYRLKKSPFHFFNVLFSALLTLGAYQLLVRLSYEVIKINLNIILFILFMFFVGLSSKVFGWLFPRVSFEFRNKISNLKKIIKYILGVAVLGLMINAGGFVIQNLIKNG